MSQVTNDLDGLTDFRNHLIQFNNTLEDEFRSMRSHWQQLGDSWRDEKYNEFGRDLDEVSQGVERYLQTAEAHEAHLAVLIHKLEAYLKT